MVPKAFVAVLLVALCLPCGLCLGQQTSKRPDSARRLLAKPVQRVAPPSLQAAAPAGEVRQEPARLQDSVPLPVVLGTVSSQGSPDEEVARSKGFGWATPLWWTLTRRVSCLLALPACPQTGSLGVVGAADGQHGFLVGAVPGAAGDALILQRLFSPTAGGSDSGGETNQLQGNAGVGSVAVAGSAGRTVGGAREPAVPATPAAGAERAAGEDDKDAEVVTVTVKVVVQPPGRLQGCLRWLREFLCGPPAPGGA